MMGIYLLNICVDTADPAPPYIPEDLSINDQESIVEFVIEIILGLDNAIEEYDDHDREDHSKKSNVKLDQVVYINLDGSIDLSALDGMIQRYPDLETCLPKGFHQLDTPPPRI
jgi:hypothetical protein